MLRSRMELPLSEERCVVGNGRKHCPHCQGTGSVRITNERRKRCCMCGGEGSLSGEQAERAYASLRQYAAGLRRITG